jgi:hypothetical protein
MKKVLCLLLVILQINQAISQVNSAITPYVSFLKEHKQSAKEYIPDLFKTHDIVVICERFHGEFTQYDLFTDIVTDKRFIENAGHVFTEIGLSSNTEALNNFLHTRNLPDETIKKQIMFFQRNCSPWPVWSNANYSFFLDKIYKANNKIAAKKAINVYPSDLLFSWTDADSSAMTDLRKMMLNRDSLIASQIIARFDEIVNADLKRRKALVIMNFRHAFNAVFIFPGGRSQKNVAWYLFNKYKDRVANVFLNTVAFDNNENMKLVQDGKWDASLKKTGLNSLGFDFANSPFGKDSFDIWPLKSDFIYTDVFTGFIYFQPVENHRLAEGIPGFIDSSFREEVYRRIELISLVNREFKSKMQNLRQAIDGENPLLNIREEKKYYHLDTLISKRESWLK